MKVSSLWLLKKSGKKAAPVYASSWRTSLPIVLPGLTLLLLQVVLADKQTLSAQEVPDEIVVTGSYVVRDGYKAPTPTSVLNRDAINTFSATNIADYLIQLPSFSGNSTPQNSRRSVSAGGAGINSLNLRSLGTARTLVLLDGQRVVASQPTGQVDINPFPQQLVQRVDVVTGGASAVYGSDAVSGVVNFVLDRRFTGFKAEAQGGMTFDGDNDQKKLAISGGIPFAEQRGHFLFSGEYSEVQGIPDCTRDWCKTGWNLINNPDYTTTNGLPERLIVNQSAPSNMTPGGIITSGPLKGTAFGPGGVPYQFDYGALNNNSFMQGGEWETNNAHQYTSLNPYAERYNLFARASYEITDNMEVFAQYSKGVNDSLTSSGVMFNPANITVRRDNAFLPQSVRDEMIARNLNTLTLGTYNRDIGSTQSDNKIELDRYVLGIDGYFNALDTEWTWNAYYQYGETVNTKSFYDRIRPRYLAAIDSVVDPGTGAIVCRSTLTDPDNGCVPWNVFGTGVNSDAARDYVAAWSFAEEYNKQKVVAGRITGTPFEIPTGEVSLALGLEHRVEDGGGIESAINAANQSWLGNQAPTFGSYKVTEGFAETVIPVFNTMPTELNAAVRLTDYSTSGMVTTWKTGLTFQPHEDLVFRGTLSRDIRAPNRRELFAAGVFTGSSVLDPFRGNINADIQSALTGNVELQPEVADTTGIGVVYQSSLIDGFSASVDYYNIEIKDAIGTVGRQEVVDRCYYGNETQFCDALVRNSDGHITVVNIRPTNFVNETARGVDIESTYRVALGDLVSGAPGDVELRGLATRYLKASVDTGTAPAIDSVGSNGNGPPKWRFAMTGTYRLDDMRVSLTGRGLSSGVYNTTNIECTSACPVSTSFNRTVDNNHMDGAVYFDLSMSYRLNDIYNTDPELFLVVQNLMDKDPAVFARGPGGNPSDPSSNPTYYDILGREIRFGVRMQF